MYVGVLHVKVSCLRIDLWYVHYPCRCFLLERCKLCGHKARGRYNVCMGDNISRAIGAFKEPKRVAAELILLSGLYSAKSTTAFIANDFPDGEGEGETGAEEVAAEVGPRRPSHPASMPTSKTMITAVLLQNSRIRSWCWLQVVKITTG